MNLAIVGTGYVGLVTGACFAEMGNRVFGVDSDREKIGRLLAGEVPIFEPGLAEMIKRSREAGNLFFTTDLAEALKEAEICFIAVGTPMGGDGGSDLSQVVGVAEEIGRLMTRDLVVVNKSTVPVGTAGLVTDIISRELTRRGLTFNFTVVSNPEFLKEGSAIADCQVPDRVIIGASDAKAIESMKELYAPFVRVNDRFLIMDVTSAEMSKYAANAMLAARISFMNEMAGICETMGADINQVRVGMGSDSRIGYKFLFAGCGYGGSCFPKDVKALIKSARDAGCRTTLLQAVEAINDQQKFLLLEKAIARFSGRLEGRLFAVWGLSFKPNTDDIREAPALILIRGLLERGASVRVYDPEAMPNAQSLGGLPPGERLHYAPYKYSALDEAEALFLVTEWKDFRSPDFAEMKARLKTPLIFDGRNQYNAATLNKLGFEYHQIGVPAEQILPAV
ncbi:MAG: UDP-glucose/GDP-mannose dehydrogenase family protein [Planctomycetes bacterium]|nr:UDP-glucose/GDP-mannose dehydrogenase family protein [Planctomycetota bacterium]